MTNSLIVEFTNNNVTEIKKFKSLKELNKAFPQYAYHQLRQVYLKTNGISTIKKLQKNAKLFDFMKIYEEDKYIENQKNNETIDQQQLEELLEKAIDV
jgi:predicted Zn-dependent protease